jgi:cytidyltransferase-like protein
LGHTDIISRATQIFPRLVVGILENPSKQTVFTPAERLEMVRELYADDPAVEVRLFSGLLVNFLQQLHATVIIRGMRAVSDFSTSSDGADEPPVVAERRNRVSDPARSTPTSPRGWCGRWWRSAVTCPLVLDDPHFLEDRMRRQIKALSTGRVVLGRLPHSPRDLKWRKARSRERLIPACGSSCSAPATCPRRHRHHDDGGR